jgi:Fic family protein
LLRKTGAYEKTAAGGEEILAFVPHPLPPADPPLEVPAKMAARAEQALARLEVAGEMVPSIDWFLYAFVRKEAVISSQIEGIEATLIDLFTFEAEARNESADVREVCNYVAALEHARKQLTAKKGLPVSMRLINEVHKILMSGVRGDSKQPGRVRRSQNFIGGTRPGNAIYVPPPPNELARALSDLEKYIHGDGGDQTALVRIGLIHAQFETIHPYLDGNGRIGRLLITLLLEHYGLLSQPLLYLSLYFKRHRAEYYRRLQAIRQDGDWEGWITYFLEGVATVGEESVRQARELFGLIGDDRKRVLATVKSSIMAARLFEFLPQHPIVTIAFVTELLETTKPTAIKAVSTLVNAGILKETTGKRRDRTFSYGKYLSLLRADTE